jgi:hypothetical protein
MYTHLDNQSSDKLCNIIDQNRFGQPIIFINKLPINITVIQEKVYSHAIINAGILPSLGNLSLAYDRHVCISYNMTKRQTPVVVGNVTAYPNIYRRDIIAGGDLSSINVHNLLCFPIVVGKNGKPIMEIQENVFLGDPLEHGNVTIAPTVSYDNFNLGINIGDQFDIYIDNRLKCLPSIQSQFIKLYSFIINDINENDIFVGYAGSLVSANTKTGASVGFNLKQGTGNAIYRIGPNNIRRDQIPNEGIGIKPKNFKTLARNLQLSGGNVGHIC